MKQFFFVVFGGLATVGCGIALIYGSFAIWQAASRELSRMDTPSLSSSVSDIAVKPDGETETSWLTRIVRYSASEEEDLINQAAQALPVGADAKITALAYVVKDLSVDSSVVSYNADRLLPIASLTKLVTAIVARRLVRPESRIPITREIVNTYGNTAGFRTGETFLAKDLYYPLLMVSSNDAAEAFAQYYGRAKFIKAMNEFAQSIGAYRTDFADPSGLSPKDVSTANDLALMLDWIRKNDPEILAITKTRVRTVHFHTWYNPTHFLSWSNYEGGKNGYTPEADRTGAALFSMGQSKNVHAVVVLGSDSRDADVIKLLKKVKE